MTVELRLMTFDRPGFKTEVEGFPIQVHQDTKTRLFSVMYGKQVWRDLSYEDAARKTGECCFHSMATEGWVDSE